MSRTVNGLPRIGVPSGTPILSVALLLACVACSPAPEAEALYRKAQAAYDEERFEEGISLVPTPAVLEELKASQAVRDRFRVLQGELIAARPDYPAAIEILSAPLSPQAEPETDRRRRGALGFAMCRFAKTVEERQQALLLLDRTLAEVKPRSREESWLQLRRGACLQRMVLYDDAVKAFSAARDAARAVNDPVLEARGHSSLGNLAANRERFDDAARHMAEALRIATTAGPKGRHVARRATDSLGWHYLELGDYDRALETLQRFQAANDRERLVNEVNLGRTYAYLGDLKQAVRHVEASLEAARNIGDSASQAAALENLAFIAFLNGDYEESARRNTEARQLITSLGQLNLLAAVQLNEARILAATGKLPAAQALLLSIVNGKSVPTNVLWSAHLELGKLLDSRGEITAAEAQYQRAMLLVEQKQSALAGDADRISFLSGSIDVYRESVKFLLRHDRTREALRAADRSRGRTLSERTGSAAEAREGAILFYWLDQPASYLWLVTGDQIRFFLLPSAAEINELIDRHNAFIQRARDPLSDGAREGRRLFEILIAPAAAHLRSEKVLIVPDGGLHALAWETLIAPNPDHYWVEDVSISVVPGLRAHPSPSVTQSRRVLLVGDPVAADPAFGKLSNASEELRRIAQLFPDAGVSVLRDAQASPRAALNAMHSDFAYVHFAAHATASRLRPLESAIILSDDGTSYRLYAGDVAKLRTGARVVTLSACQAAGAKAYRGEGLVGFAWAFLGAGAENVIATLWPVDDASTPRLMEQTYRQMQLGHPPGDALREAKLAFLRSGTALRKPFYWAAFLHFQH